MNERRVFYWDRWNWDSGEARDRSLSEELELAIAALDAVELCEWGSWYDSEYGSPLSLDEECEDWSLDPMDEGFEDWSPEPIDEEFEDWLLADEPYLCY